MRMLASKGLKLGLVVDLTNTERYYDRRVSEDGINLLLLLSLL